MSEIFFNFLTSIIIGIIVLCVIEGFLIYILLKKVTNFFFKFLLMWVILFITPFWIGVITINIYNYNIGILGLEKGLEHLLFFYRNITPSLALGALLIDIILLCRKMKINRFKISKYTMYSIPIVLFFIAWCVVVVNAIIYLGPYLDAIGLDITYWPFNWLMLSDEYLLILNTFSSFFFGCFSWSIMMYYLGTANQKRYLRVIRLIVLSLMFWFGVCVMLCITGVSTYSLPLSIWHVLFGLWVATGSIIATLKVVSALCWKIGYSSVEYLPLDYSDPIIQVPRSKYIKFRDFFERYISGFFVIMILILGFSVSFFSHKISF